MSITPKNKSSKTVSERERFIGFVYVLTLFIVITGACGFILFKYAGTRHIFSNKIMVIKKMERQKEFQNIQSVQIVSADTHFHVLNSLSRASMPLMRKMISSS